MSPKNKGKFGKGKPAVEPDDEFVSTMSRVGKALQPYVKQIVIGVSVVAVLLIAIFGYRWYSARQERQATTLYAKAARLANTAILPQSIPEPDAEAPDGDNPDGAKDGADKPAGEAVFNPEDRNDDGLPDSFPTRADRAKAVLPLLTKLQSDYGSTDTAKSARLLHATMLYDVGDYAAAEKMYKGYLSSSGPSLLKRVAREGMGASSEALAMANADPGQRTAALERTLTIYRDIQRTEKAAGWERALYHQARILAIQGKKDEAKKLLEQALVDVPNSLMKDEIEDRLTTLEAGK